MWFFDVCNNQKIEPKHQLEYIHIFNNSKPPPEVKIGYTLTKVEKYILYQRRYQNFQKYGHLKEACSRKPVHVKCGAHMNQTT